MGMIVSVWAMLVTYMRVEAHPIDVEADLPHRLAQARVMLV
jgi:hypothetical protein